MNIPLFEKDIAIIQKLSDLPNSTDGLSADELKAKFDEAGLAIQSWINETFIPALTANNLPFDSVEQINAENVQSAIEYVFKQIRDVSSGTISDGSVTKEKIASELLSRIYGGRAWVSLNKPEVTDNPTTDFPIGQIWLRPGVSIDNLVGSNWNGSTACSVTAEENKITVQGDKTSTQADATLNMSNIGQDGDRVYVLFDIKEKDDKISSLTVSLNGGAEESVLMDAHTATLSGGALSIRFRALWSDSSLADGKYIIENLSVVNVDAIMRQTTNCAEVSDWGTYLRNLLPFKNHDDHREMYMQTAGGVWQLFNYEVFPVNRGGTGVKVLENGEMICGNGTDKVHVVKTPKTENCILQFADGLPAWKTPQELANSSKLALHAEANYTGSGKEREIELPHAPAVLWLRFDDKTIQFFQNSTFEGRYTGTVTQMYGNQSTTITKMYTSGVTLDGCFLKFWKELPELDEYKTWTSGDAVHFNEENKQYTWTAL